MRLTRASILWATTFLILGMCLGFRASTEQAPPVPLSAPMQVGFGQHPEHPRSSHWPKVRKDYLAEHATCAGCGTDQLLEVHHVLPFHLYPERELDPTNLITLCQTPEMHCHFRLGHLANWRSYNKNVREDAAQQLKRIKERP